MAGADQARFNGPAPFPGNKVDGKGCKDTEASDGGQGKETEPGKRGHAVERNQIGGEEADDQPCSGQDHDGHDDTGCREKAGSHAGCGFRSSGEPGTHGIPGLSHFVLGILSHVQGPAFQRAAFGLFIHHSFGLEGIVDILRTAKLLGDFFL